MEVLAGRDVWQLNLELLPLQHRTFTMNGFERKSCIRSLNVDTNAK